ncbi:MAG: DUF1361 domain-containing protein [Solirubrobacteraceae bacterium]
MSVRLTATPRTRPRGLPPPERLRTLRRIGVVLAVCSLYCSGLEIARVIHTGSSQYDFLIWNLFLAWIPFVLAWLLGSTARRGVRPLGILLLGLVWLLFFPNAPYIVTDFVHLRGPATAPLWFDVVLIASFASTGILLGFVSLTRVQQVVTEAAGAALGWLAAVVALVLAAFGIFIGRFEARNSWDVIMQPVPLARDTWHQLTSPAAYPRALGVTASYALFLILAYLVLRVAAGTLSVPGGTDPTDAHRVRGTNRPKLEP